MNPADESTSWTPDGLVAHNARLRRLAVGLAGETDADDLVQDAWGAALQHSGKGVESPTAWLSGAVRHLAQMMRRGEARRCRRERVAARGEAIASPEVAVARVELHREIADAVLGLPEIARQVVILRFFEDLTPAEIAEHLGMPAATVRTRLHRALERLRVRLDANHGGERSAWAALVLPGALVREAAVSGASALAAKGLVKGVLAVSAKKLLVGAAILLALGMFVVVWRDLQSASAPDAPPPLRLAGHETEEAGPGDPGASDRKVIPTVPFAESSTMEGASGARRILALYGRIQTEAGNPAYPAKLVIQVDGRNHNGNTSKDGRYAMRVEGSLLTHASVSYGDGSFVLEEAPPIARIPEGETSISWNIMVPTLSEIRGRVLDSGSAPVEGYSLRLSQPAHELGSGYRKTDAHGGFVFHVPWGGRVKMHAGDSNDLFPVGPLPQPVVPRGGCVDTGNIVVAPLRPVSIQFLDDTTGEPVTGVEIKVYCEGRGSALPCEVTDREGRVEVRCAVGTHWMAAYASGYQSVPNQRQVTVDPAEEPTTVSWRLRSTWTTGLLQALVTDPSGAPVMDAQVRWGDQEATTGPTGYCTLQVEGREARALTISHPDYETLKIESCALGRFPIQIFAIEPIQGTEILVEDADGNPVTKLDAALFSSDEGSRSWTVIKQWNGTDDEGRFRLPWPELGDGTAVLLWARCVGCDWLLPGERRARPVAVSLSNR